MPDPITFSKYPKEIQEKMVEWNDVRIIDSSKRQDYFVNKYVKHCDRAQILNFILCLLPIAFSIIAFVMTKDIACFSALSVPLVTVAYNIVKDCKNKENSEDK